MKEPFSMDKCLVISTSLGLFLTAPAVGADSAWVWGNNPSAVQYSPDTNYALNPADGAIRINRKGPGKYSVLFANMREKIKVSSNVQVSAYGPGSVSCKVQGWTPQGNDLLVNVLCFQASGTPADSKFTALVSFPAPASASKTAYAWADKPKAADYNANKNYAHNPSRRPVQIRRTAKGKYEARFPGLHSTAKMGGNVQVTAYGPGSENCKVQNWLSVGKALVARILCFSAAGSPVDTRFSVLVMGP